MEYVLGSREAKRRNKENQIFFYNRRKSDYRRLLSHLQDKPTQIVGYLVLENCSREHSNLDFP